MGSLADVLDSIERSSVSASKKKLLQFRAVDLSLRRPDDHAVTQVSAISQFEQTLNIIRRAAGFACNT